MNSRDISVLEIILQLRNLTRDELVRDRDVLTSSSTTSVDAMLKRLKSDRLRYILGQLYNSYLQIKKVNINHEERTAILEGHIPSYFEDKNNRPNPEMVAWLRLLKQWIDKTSLTTLKEAIQEWTNAFALAESRLSQYENKKLDIESKLISAKYADENAKNIEERYTQMEAIKKFTGNQFDLDIKKLKEEAAKERAEAQKIRDTVFNDKQKLDKEYQKSRFPAEDKVFADVLIDPTNLTPETAEVLDQFLQYQFSKGNYEYQPHQTYTFIYVDKNNNNKRPLEIRLTHKLAYYQSENPHNKRRYAVIDTTNRDPVKISRKIDEYNIEGVLKYNSDGKLSYKKQEHNSKVLQSERLENQFDLKAAKRKDLLFSDIPYLGAKPAILQRSSASVTGNVNTVMRQLGEPLERVLQKNLSRFERLILARNIIKAVDEQLSGIVHGNLNRQNIFVDNSLNVYVSNFNTAREVSPRSPNYKKEREADIAATGYVLARIMGAEEGKLDINKKNFNDDISLEDKQVITNLLNNLVVGENTLTNAYNLFDKLALQYGGNNSEEVHLAHHVARETSFKIKDALNEEAISLNKLKAIFLDSLKEMNDPSPNAVNEFTFTLGVKAFKDFQTKGDIEEKLKDFDVLQEKIVGLRQLYEKAKFYNTVFNKIDVNNETKNTLSKLQKEIDIAYYKLNKCELTVDAILALNQKINLDSMKKKMDGIELKLKEQDQGKYLVSEGYKNIINGILSSSKNQVSSSIKKALLEYITSTFTSANIRKSQRSLSEKRIRNINEVLEIIDKGPNEDEIVNNLRRKVLAIRGSNSFTRFFDQSELCKELELVIKNYDINQVLEHNRNRPGV